MNERYLFRGKRVDNGEWVEGYSIQGDKDYIATVEAINLIASAFHRASVKLVEVSFETVEEYTDLFDKNGKPIFEGDIVKIVDFQAGIVTYECGAFGVSIIPRIDWDYLDSEIAEITGCDNMPYFCRNDNFISLWELMWNYNQEENYCEVVEVIGNIHDNPELLEV